jgi:diguanylate cyclase (GGDEF)-like protein
MSRKVLLLDDDESFRRIVRESLVEAGLEVLEAGKSREAQRIIEKDAPDLAIVDGLLPDENGFDLIARLRRQGNRIPIVFVSAFWRDIASYKRLTRELEVALVMHKPLDPGRLADRVAVLLRKRKPRSSEPRMTLPYASPDIVRDYGRRLPDRLTELRDVLKKLDADGEDAGARFAVRRIAHKLRGSAGSYGYEDVATVAGRIEDALAGEHLPPAGVDAELEKLAKKYLDAQDDDANDPLLPPQVVDRPLILVADDDTMFLEDVVDIAEAQLLDLQVASTVDDALKLAEAEMPDVAFVGMPLGEPDRSLELVAKLREQHPSLPVGVIGLDESTVARAAAARTGSALFLSHPVNADGLAHAVARLRRHDPEGPDAAMVVALTEDDVLRGRLTNLEREAIAIATCAANDALVTLDRNRPDVVLVDAEVGSYHGAELCRMLRATLQYAEIPILLFSQSVDAKERASALEAGADDALSKLDVVTEWAKRIRLAAGAAQRRAVPAIDTVTHLPGRAPTMSALSVKLHEARRHDRSFVLALVDIDGLEEVNVEHGRSAGDRILTSLASALRSRFRSEDVRGRLGPDELVVGFSDADPKIADVLSRVRRTFAGLELTAPSGESYGATFSIGVATFPRDGKSIPALIAAAEERLLQDRERDE